MDFDLIESLSPDSIEQLYDDTIRENDRLAGWAVRLSGRCSDGRIVESTGFVRSNFAGSAMEVGYCTYNTGSFGSNNFLPCGGGPAKVCVINSREDTTCVLLDITCEDGTLTYGVGFVPNGTSLSELAFTVGYCTYNTGGFESKSRPECNGDPAKVCVLRVLDD